MDLADQLGFLVINETPVVGLFFRQEGLQRCLELCQQMTHEVLPETKITPV